MIRGLVRVTRSAAERRPAGAGSAASRLAGRRPACGPSGRPAPPAPPRPARPPAGAAPGAPAAAGGAPWPPRPRSARTVAASTIAAARRSCRPAGVGPAAHPASPSPATRPRKREGEHPVRPVQRGQGGGGRQHAAVAEREAEAEEAGVEVGDLRAEQDDHEAERRPWRAPSRGRRAALAAGRGPPAAPARSATTISAASSSMALARWVMITQGGSASFTVTAPSSTWTTSSTSGQQSPGSGAPARPGAGARPPAPRRTPAG